MRPHLEAFVGAGWDQLLALMTIVGIASASATGGILFFLRFRLARYFVTRPDHAAFREKLSQEHEENTDRLRKLEDQTEKLATKHSLNGIIQRQESLSQQITGLQTAHASMAGEIGRIGDGVDGVKHIMKLVLENLLQRDKL